MTADGSAATHPAGIALVTGAGGQDGFFLVRRLLREGWTVHAVARPDTSKHHIADSSGYFDRLYIHGVDLLDADAVLELVAEVMPHEIYNLAGQSSVSASFASPAGAWRSNAMTVQVLLEAVRQQSPSSRVYQASSGEMFGASAGAHVLHDEDSPFMPASPYAASKAAAHVLCGAYRRAFGVRVACGILFNHESRRRPGQFLTRKVVDHVRQVRESRTDIQSVPPLRVGNLRAQRDWGYAPDYVDGMIAILRQVSIRAALLASSLETDTAESYRDYVLATGRLHAVWELIDRAFALAGIPIDWHMDSEDVRTWHARYRSSGGLAVVVDPAFLRPSDPVSIAADPSRAKHELGWSPRMGLDVLLDDMLAPGP